MNLPLSAVHQSNKEDISDYVAHLQIHMSLQSRNLLPQIDQVKDSRDNLLYQTQANIEKLTSRQLG